MSKQQTDFRGGRWGIVLAGGEGERLQPVIRRWLGVDRPKQYCTFSGGRTMLEFTLDRARAVVPPNRILTVIGPGHRRFLPPDLDAGRVIEQPARRDTGPGIFLPAAHALKADPDATLIIFPSDHYVSPASEFRRAIEEAAVAAERQPDRIVLLGAAPDAAEEDYGWIEPDWSSPRANGTMPVAAFREKPDSAEAAALYERGCLWNTFIMAVKARTLWDIGRVCLPRMMEVFIALLPCLGGSMEGAAVKAAYDRLEGANFSTGVLAAAPQRVLVKPMTGVEWSDWGRPGRIAQTLTRRGLPTPFMRELASPAFV